jgi:short-subunit dehydrogenase
MNEGSRLRRRALVTGASSGIGLAFARLLSAEGYDLILTARRADRLEQLAAELRGRDRTDVVLLPADLSQHDAVERLTRAIADRSLQVDLLVNNAGFGVPGAYASTTWPQQREFLQVLVIAVAELSHRVVPGMIERRWGRIIKVASVAGMMPGVAGHTLYAASKAFVIKFSESLALETARHGVHV